MEQSSVCAIRSVFTVHCLNCKIKSDEISVDRPWEKISPAIITGHMVHMYMYLTPPFCLPNPLSSRPSYPGDDQIMLTQNCLSHGG